MDHIDMTALIQSWRDGYHSDCEALYRLCADLPASPVTDMVIEIVGKMYQEEVAEWEEDARVAEMLHRADEEDVGQALVDELGISYKGDDNNA